VIVTASVQSEKRENIFHVPDRPGLPEKILNRVLVFEESFSWAGRAARQAQSIARAAPFDLVFSTSPPLAVHIAARRVKRRLGIPWVADFRDPMTGNDARLGWAIHTVDRIFEPRFFKDADVLIANTEAAANFLKIRRPEYAKKVRFIYNGFDPATPGLAARPLPTRSHRVLLHAGSLYRVSMTQPFIEALDLALARRSGDAAPVRLQMIGLVEAAASLRALPAFHNLERLGRIELIQNHWPVAEARRAMAESDFLVVIDRYRQGGIIQLPAKTYEYIQIGRPILAVTAPGSPMEYVIRTSGVRHALLYPERESTDAMAAKIADFVELPSDPLAPSPEYDREFGAAGQSETLAGIFDALLERRRIGQ